MNRYIVEFKGRPEDKTTTFAETDKQAYTIASETLKPKPTIQSATVRLVKENV